MKQLQISVPDEYKWIMLCTVILALQCILTNFIVVVRARFRHFKPEHMEKTRVRHQETFGGNTLPIIGGFPDCGSGLYSDILEY